MLWNPYNHRLLDEDDFAALAQRGVKPWKFRQQPVRPICLPPLTLENSAGNKEICKKAPHVTLSRHARSWTPYKQEMCDLPYLIGHLSLVVYPVQNLLYAYDSQALFMAYVDVFGGVYKGPWLVLRRTGPQPLQDSNAASSIFSTL